MGAVCPREELRDAILDAATRLMERYGYKKMTMDDLAREVGIGKGTIYLHFRSKEEVALSVVDRTNARLHCQLRAILRSSGTPVERLRRMLLLRVLYRFDNVSDKGKSLDEFYTALRPALLEMRDRLYQKEAGILAEILIEGRLVGTFDFEDAMATAHTLLLATSGLMPFSLSARELGDRSQVEERTSGVIDLLLHGLLSRRSA